MRARRNLALAPLLLAALLLRAIVPVGLMPSAVADGSFLTLCPDSFGSAAITALLGEHAHHNHHQHHDPAASGVDTAAVIVGGCGHVGLPLGICLANAGMQVWAFDLNSHAVDIVNSGVLPFREDGAEDLLQAAQHAGTFTATTDPASIRKADIVVIVIGTPVDEHLNPDPNAVVHALLDCLPHMRDGQLLVLRSTVFPGVTARVEEFIREAGLDIEATFCPERIAEGKAIEELYSLPQIIGARSEEASRRAARLFARLGVETIPVLPEEAELAKLFTNTCLLYTSPSPRDLSTSRMPSSA